MGRITLTSEVGGDGGEEEEVSLTSLASPSNWQKLDLLALSLTTVTSRRVGAAGGGGGTLCVKLHTVCKITSCVQNYTLCASYTLCVKVHTVCKILC